MAAQTAVAAMAGSLASHLHAQHVPWPAAGTVPILDMIELCTPAFLLLKAWSLVAPLATTTTLAAAAMSAWTVWVPRPEPERPGAAACLRIPLPRPARRSRSRQWPRHARLV